MKRIMLIVLTAVMAMAAMGCSAAAQLRVDFYDVGKADAMLITMPQGQRILIDAATNDEGKKLVKRFEKEGIDAIDLMIITHFDKDHVGGADKIIEKLKVAQVLAPRYDKESKQHTQFIEAVETSRDTQLIEMSTAQRLEFEAGGAQFIVTAAQRTSYGKDEENSDAHADGQYKHRAVHNTAYLVCKHRKVGLRYGYQYAHKEANRQQKNDALEL